MRFGLLSLSLLLSASFGCVNSEAEGTPTGSVCDPDLSYDRDVAPIVEHYCLACHSVSVPLAERHGAPGDHNFDTEADLNANALHVQMAAGIGPDAENRSMPPKGFAKPTDDERITLARFLECQVERESPSAEHHHH